MQNKFLCGESDAAFLALIILDKYLYRKTKIHQIDIFTQIGPVCISS